MNVILVKMSIYLIRTCLVDCLKIFFFVFGMVLEFFCIKDLTC